MVINTASPEQAMVQVIRESFGRVVYSHKTHEKAREFASAKSDRVKWVNIVLTTLTSATLLSSVITDEKTLLYLSGALSAAALAFTVFQLSFDPEKEAERHRNTANELWYVRERYVNLLADLTQGGTVADAGKRRDELIEALKTIYKFAPDTDSKAYVKAQRALQVNEDMTFSSEEIDRFLPESLRISR